MIKPSHYQAPRTIHDAVFTDCRYATPPRSRADVLLDALVAIALGLAGALVLFFGLSS